MNSIIKNELNQFKKSIPLLTLLALDEIKVRYIRSILGPFWLVLATAISALGLGYIWSILFNQDKETFIPALCVGLVIWQFLSTCIIEAPNCYNTYSSILRNNYTSVLLFAVTIVFKNFIIFLHNMILVAAVYLIYPPDINFDFFLIIPGLFLVLGNLVFWVTIIAFLGARYRDISPAITSVMTVVFFLSPVIYKPSQLGLKENLIWFNPFSHLITLIRDPISGMSPDNFVYLTMVATLVISVFISYTLISRYRFRLIYWL